MCILVFRKSGPHLDSVEGASPLGTVLVSDKAASILHRETTSADRNSEIQDVTPWLLSFVYCVITSTSILPNLTLDISRNARRL
jgi:hypothetical protein